MGPSVRLQMVRGHLVPRSAAVADGECADLARGEVSAIHVAEPATKWHVGAVVKCADDLNTVDGASVIVASLTKDAVGRGPGASSAVVEDGDGRSGNVAYGKRGRLEFVADPAGRLSNENLKAGFLPWTDVVQPGVRAIRANKTTGSIEEVCRYADTVDVAVATVVHFADDAQV